MKDEEILNLEIYKDGFYLLPSMQTNALLCEGDEIQVKLKDIPQIKTQGENISEDMDIDLQDMKHFVNKSKLI